MSKDDMWEHNCIAEGCEMLVGKGDECSWCGERETETANCLMEDE